MTPPSSASPTPTPPDSTSPTSDAHNVFQSILDAHGSREDPERARAITADIGDTIPFVATAGVEIETYTPVQVRVALDDRPAVHNHVGTAHASALSLLAETATGLVVALNLPEGAVPLLRSMQIDFRRMARGRVTARAALSPAEQERIAGRPIGKVDVEVSLVSPDAEEPAVRGTLQWAWLPESRMQGSSR